MPGGVGPVSKRMIAGSKQERAISGVDNPVEIFFNLDSSRVFYDSAQRILYFVDSPHTNTGSIIKATLTGLNSSAVIEQMHLDQHRFFIGASRIKFNAGEIDSVLVALRLGGIHAVVR